MNSVASAIRQNQLLSKLPAKERALLAQPAELVALHFAEVLAEEQAPIRYVHFPTESFISLVASSQGQPRLEVGLIGDEGMLGLSLLFGVNRAPLHAVVQGAGLAVRLPAAAFIELLPHCPKLTTCLQRYAHVTLGQLAQTALCTRFHEVEARLARWLLMSSDRAHSADFHMTHEFLAYMLGVRRVGITEAASRLQGLGLIRYRRGDVSIVDRRGLEARACPCYVADRENYERWL